MKRCSLIAWVFFLFLGSLLPHRGTEDLRAESTPYFMLQIAAFPTLPAARKEIERLKAQGISARYLVKEDPAGNPWYAVYIDLFPSREEAAREGNRLIQKGVIRTFFIFPYQGRAKESETPLSEPESARLKKKSGPLSDKRPLVLGPVVIKEEESHLLMTVGLERRIFPKIYTQKNDFHSRLFVTFPAVDKAVVPITFRKDRPQALLSFSVSQKNTECTFILVLNPAYNFEVSQNFFEKEKLYSLKIRWEAAGGG